MNNWYIDATGVLYEPHPDHIGVYACRVDDLQMGHPFQKDVFLMWMDGRWSYLGSDQRFRGDVYGFVGPIPRTKS